MFPSVTHAPDARHISSPKARSTEASPWPRAPRNRTTSHAMQPVLLRAPDRLQAPGVASPASPLLTPQHARPEGTRDVPSAPLAAMPPEYVLLCARLMAHCPQQMPAIEEALSTFVRRNNASATAMAQCLAQLVEHDAATMHALGPVHDASEARLLQQVAQLWRCKLVSFAEHLGRAPAAQVAALVQIVSALSHVHAPAAKGIESLTAQLVLPQALELAEHLELAAPQVCKSVFAWVVKFVGPTTHDDESASVAAAQRGQHARAIAVVLGAMVNRTHDEQSTIITAMDDNLARIADESAAQQVGMLSAMCNELCAQFGAAAPVRDGAPPAAEQAALPQVQTTALGTQQTEVPASYAALAARLRALCPEQMPVIEDALYTFVRRNAALATDMADLLHGILERDRGIFDNHREVEDAHEALELQQQVQLYKRHFALVAELMGLTPPTNLAIVHKIFCAPTLWGKSSGPILPATHAQLALSRVQGLIDNLARATPSVHALFARWTSTFLATSVRNVALAPNDLAAPLRTQNAEALTKALAMLVELDADVQTDVACALNDALAAMCSDPSRHSLSGLPALCSQLRAERLGQRPMAFFQRTQALVRLTQLRLAEAAVISAQFADVPPAQFAPIWAGALVYAQTQDDRLINAERMARLRFGQRTPVSASQRQTMRTYALIDHLEPIVANHRALQQPHAAADAWQNLQLLVDTWDSDSDTTEDGKPSDP